MGGFYVSVDGQCSHANSTNSCPCGRGFQLWFFCLNQEVCHQTAIVRQTSGRDSLCVVKKVLNQRTHSYVCKLYLWGTFCTPCLLIRTCIWPSVVSLEPFCGSRPDHRSALAVSIGGRTELINQKGGKYPLQCHSRKQWDFTMCPLIDQCQYWGHTVAAVDYLQLKRKF